MTRNLPTIALSGATGSRLRFLFQKVYVEVSFCYGKLIAGIAGGLSIILFWNCITKKLFEPNNKTAANIPDSWRLHYLFIRKHEKAALPDKAGFSWYSGISLIAALISNFNGFRITNNI